MNTKKTIAFLLFAFVLFITTTNFGQATGDKLPPIKYQEFILPNGLGVIMHVYK